MKAIKMFEIHKKGVTNGWITIVKMPDQEFNKEKKIEKYLSLGYQVRQGN